VNHSDSLALIEGFRPDLLVSIAGNEIFKAPLIKLAPKGCLNVHTALLPDYRGLLPTFWAMKNEERQTGVSVFFVDRGIDSGPILLQQAVEIGDKTLEELIRCTKELGIKLTIEAVNRIHRGDCPLIRNDISKGRYYSFPTREDVKEFYARGKKFY
jgi:methionyl-tRNA formyltransferase